MNPYTKEQVEGVFFFGTLLDHYEVSGPRLTFLIRCSDDANYLAITYYRRILRSSLDTLYNLGIN